MTNNSSKKVNIEVFKYLAEKGFQLIPLYPWNDIDKKTSKSKAKIPRDKNWTTRIYDNNKVIQFAEKTNSNLGIRLPSHIMVIDVDPRNFPEGIDSFEEFKKSLNWENILYATPYTKTGSGGYHIFLKKPASLSILDSLDSFKGIEFKSLGRQVVAAGSIHPNTEKQYELEELFYEINQIQDAPEVLLNLIRRPTKIYGDASGAGEITAEQLATTLEQIPVEDYREHDLWFKLMAACHFITNGEGRQEFIDWSTSDPTYKDDAWIIGRRWDSLHIATNRGDRPITGRYLHQEVQKYGGFVTPTAAKDDFEVYEDPAEIGYGVDNQDLPPEISESEKVLEELNSLHCVVMENGKFRIITEEYDPVLKRRYIQRSTKDDFENLYANQLVEKGGKLVTKATYWLRHPKRRQYKGIIFDPSSEHEGYFNLWQGWAVEPKQGNWDLLKQLILEVLVNNNKEYYKYILNWLAYMIQHPSQAAEVALCFRGEKGTGKGTIGRAVAALAGQHGLHISSPEHLIGRFNTHLRSCILLFADEAFWAGDKPGEAKLKQLITEPVISYEGKGKDIVSGRNLIHIIIASNNDWVVPAGLDGERRFAVFEANNSKQGDQVFFKALNKQLYQEGGLNAMLYELMLRDITDWAPRQKIPQSDALIEQKLHSMDIEYEWIYAHLSDGFLPFLNHGQERERWLDKETNLEIADVVDSHNYFARSKNRYPKKQHTITALLKKIGIEVKQHTKGSNKGIRYYAFPCLEVTRKHFQKLINAPDVYPLWN